jgi:hypothetical protein
VFSSAVALLCGVAVDRARALDPNTRDPRVIMQAASQQATGTRTLMRVKMTIHDSGGSRERILDMRSERTDHARKSLILIESPSDVRNTGFLSIDYRSKDHADEQWLYLPKLHRVTRVPNSGKSDPFLGSDFSYSDLVQQDPDDFQFTLLEPSVKVGNEECWLIEASPRTPEVQEASGYRKIQTWLSKSKLIPLQTKGWTAKDDKIKYFKAMNVRQIDGIWTPERLQMRTVKSEKAVSDTVLELLTVQNNANVVSDADFSQARLERGL